eukprot:4914834-Amphidinium_carterae.1
MDEVWNEEGRHQEAQQRHERRRQQPARARHEGTAQELIDKYQALLESQADSCTTQTTTSDSTATHGWNERGREPDDRQEGERQPMAAPPGIPSRRSSTTTSTRTWHTNSATASLSRTRQLEYKLSNTRRSRRITSSGSATLLQGSPQETIFYTKKNVQEAEEPTEQAEPVLPTDDGLTVNSSTNASPEDERGEEEEREHDTPVASPEDDEQNYWDNIETIVKENWRDERKPTTSQELKEGVLYFMELILTDDLVKRARDMQRRSCYETVRCIHMSKVEDELWRQLEERGGRLVDTNDYIVARDTMNTELYDTNGEQRCYRRNYI